LPVSYVYSGTPVAHYLMGFDPDTPYHITDSGSVIAIGSATGTSDTTADSEGMIII